MTKKNIARPVKALVASAMFILVLAGTLITVGMTLGANVRQIEQNGKDIADIRKTSIRRLTQLRRDVKTLTGLVNKVLGKLQDD